MEGVDTLKALNTASAMRCADAINAAKGFLEWNIERRPKRYYVGLLQVEKRRFYLARNARGKLCDVLQRPEKSEYLRDPPRSDHRRGCPKRRA